MKVTFTGTRSGMTNAQRTKVREVFNELQISRLIHGDCIGADADAHSIALDLGLPPEEICIYPANIPHMRANCSGGTVMADPAPPLERDEEMVEMGEVLVATPRTNQEEKRSGTWYTVRYARKCDRRIFLVWPDGKVTEE